VKRSGRDEPMCIEIHKCVETMLRISLYSYLYLKLAKLVCLSHYLLCFAFSSTKSVKKRAEQVLPGSGGGESGWVRGGEGWRGAVAQTMYTHEIK
jgi:hypothetical protein